MKMLAGGSVLASGSLLRAAPPTEGAPADLAGPVVIPDTVWDVTTSVRPPATSAVILARVARCRSWDGSVYLAAPGLGGYAQLSPHAFAIAAACQAADRPVAMRYRGHDPRWAQGCGRFDGVVLAIDPRDLDVEGGGPWA